MFSSKFDTYFTGFNKLILSFSLFEFILLLTCNCVSCNVDSELISLKHLQKRQEYEDYRSCARNFEIHQDKIIRTEESKKMGAKYLNAKDISSKDECEKACCETLNCNVFVLEEKVLNQQLGTCYLFDCGTPESFKCKFTRHHNYSSAVLIINGPQMQLGDEIQYSQHERELTNLRSNEDGDKNSKNCHHNNGIPGNSEESSSVKDTVKDSMRIADENTENLYKKGSSKCSRYQFECRTSGECIAIYNACDGIPQCADHSDEDVELGCPTSAPLSAPKKLDDRRIADDKKQSPDSDSFPKPAQLMMKDNNIQPEYEQNPLLKQQLAEKPQIPLQQQTIQFHQQQPFNRPMTLSQWKIKMNPQFYDGSPTKNELPINDNYLSMINSNVGSKILQQSAIGAASPFAGREEESNAGGAFLAPNSWKSKHNEDQNPNIGPLRNFNHQQSEINVPYNNYGDYKNVPINAPDEVYNHGSAPVNGYLPNSNQWLQYSNYRSNSGPKAAENNKPYEPSESRIKSDYYYGTKGAHEKVIDPVETLNQSAGLLATQDEKLIDRKLSTLQTTARNINLADRITMASSKSAILSESVTVTTTTQIKQSAINESVGLKSVKLNSHDVADVPTLDVKNSSHRPTTNLNEPNSHKKVENQFAAELSDVREQLLELSDIKDGYTDQPSGAFVSLTLGVCVTAIMIFVVGCRLEVLRKRIRRRGKAAYTQDSDFLVNGMYL